MLAIFQEVGEVFMPLIVSILNIISPFLSIIFGEIFKFIGFLCSYGNVFVSVLIFDFCLVDTIITH